MPSKEENVASEDLAIHFRRCSLSTGLCSVVIICKGTGSRRHRAGLCAAEETSLHCAEKSAKTRRTKHAHTPAVPALRKMRQEDEGFKEILIRSSRPRTA